MKRSVKSGLILAAAMTALAVASCSKIDEQVRIERIPLPQGQIDNPDPDWQPQPDVDQKTHK